MLNRMEKVSKTLFTTGSSDDSNVRLQISAVVLLGSKGQDDKRLSPLYTKEYESQKYSNRNNLQNLTITTSDFIVINYSDFDNKVISECYISYPHLDIFRQFISDIYDMVINPETCVFTEKNKIKKGMTEETVYPEKNFSNDSLVWAIPAVIQRTEDSTIERGIYIFVNEEDNYIEISEAGIRTLYELFVASNYNLLNTSLNLLTIAMLNDMVSSGESDESSPAGRNRNPRQRPGRNSSSTNRKPSSKKPTRKNKDEEEEEYEEEEEGYEETEEEEEEAPKRKGNKNNKTNKKDNGKKTSFSRILEEAKNIEMDDEEELDMDDEE